MKVSKNDIDLLESLFNEFQELISYRRQIQCYEFNKLFFNDNNFSKKEEKSLYYFFNKNNIDVSENNYDFENEKTVSYRKLLPFLLNILNDKIRTNKIEKKFILSLLTYVKDRLSGRGCNDFKYPEWCSFEDRNQLAYDFSHYVNGGGQEDINIYNEEILTDISYTNDFTLFATLIYRIEKYFEAESIKNICKDF